MVTLLLLATATANPVRMSETALNRTCNDDRFPRLTSAWIVACDARRMVAMAHSIEDGRQVQFPRTPSVGIDNGRLLVPGEGLFELQNAAQPLAINVPKFAREPTLNGALAAWVTPDLKVAWLQLAAQQVQVIEESAVRRGTHVAITQQGIAWVEDNDRKDADLWWLPFDTDTPQPLDTGAGDQHLPVAHGAWLAWTSNGNVVMWNTETDQKRRFETNTGFNAEPTLWNDVACWEYRDASHPDLGIDIHCSDGFRLQLPGHQTHPSRWRNRLLFRDQSSQLMLYTIEQKP